jgi:hypothetical protein
MGKSKNLSTWRWIRARLQSLRNNKQGRAVAITVSCFLAYELVRFIRPLDIFGKCPRVREAEREKGRSRSRRRDRNEREHELHE